MEGVNQPGRCWLPSPLYTPPRNRLPRRGPGDETEGGRAHETYTSERTKDEERHDAFASERVGNIG